MWINVPSLQVALADAELCEFRQPQGKRYELQPVLLLSCVALMCGARSEQEIAEWCIHYGERWVKWLGIKNERRPSTGTISRIFRGVNGARLEAAVILWTQQILEFLQLPTDEEDEEWDEWTARPENAEFTVKRWAEGSELLFALSSHLKSLLDRLAGSTEREGRSTHRDSLLAGLILTGYIETKDLQEVCEEKVSPPHKDSDEVRPGYFPGSIIPGPQWHQVAI